MHNLLILLGTPIYRDDNIVYITNEAASKNSAAFDTDGAVTLYYDNAAAISTASDSVSLADSKKVKLGGGNDLQLYHDGSDSYITDTGTGNLLIQYSDLYFSKDAGSTHSVVFRSTGNVGIGLTKGPDEALHVNGNVMLNNANEIRSKDTGGSTRTIVRVNSSNELEFGWSGTGNVKFMGGSSYTERMRINTNGTVNIGNINFSGNSSDSTISTGNANMKISTLDITGGAGNLDFDIYLAITGGIQEVFQVEAAGSGDTYTNDGSVSSLSDERIKTDIISLS